MRKNVLVSFSLILLFTFLLFIQLHRPIFADQTPLSGPISGPITSPITGPIISVSPVLPSASPSVVPSVSVTPIPSSTLTDTPTPTEQTPTPTGSVFTPTPTPTKHHRLFNFFGENFYRFLSFRDIWIKFLNSFAFLSSLHENNGHVSFGMEHTGMSFSSAVHYLADGSCANGKQKYYSNFDF